VEHVNELDTHKERAREYGRDNGRAAVVLGEWQDTDTADVVRGEAFQAEENARQFSPFEHFAADVNGLGEWDAEDVWDAYEIGVAEGVEAGLVAIGKTAEGGNGDA
jgi:hypothetical protein